MRTRPSARRVARLVAQWQASDETQAGFARRHGIPPWTFWYWCRKLRAADGVSPSGPAFVPVRVTEPDAASVVEIVLTSGDRVQVRPRGIGRVDRRHAARAPSAVLTLSPAVRNVQRGRNARFGLQFRF